MAHEDPLSVDFPSVGEPLQGLYPTGQAETPAAEPTQPFLTPERREMLARVLLGLGSIGKYKQPQFLTDELKQRGIENRTKATEERKTSRLQAASALIAQAREAESAGNDVAAMGHYRAALPHIEDPTMMKEALTGQAQAAGRMRMAVGAGNVAKYVTELGFEKIDHITKLNVYTELVRSGMPPAQAENFVSKEMTIRWTESKDGTTALGVFPDNRPPIQVPLAGVHALGQHALIQMFGPNVVKKIAEVPETQALTPEQELVQKPGVQLYPPVPPTAAPGTVAPMGGLPATPAAGAQPSALEVLRPGKARETPLTPDQRAFLVGTPFAQVRTFEELDRQGGGATLTKAVADARQADLARTNAEWDRRTQEMTNAIEARTEARITETKAQERRAPVKDIGNWYHVQTFTPGQQGQSTEELEKGGFRHLTPPQAQTFGAVVGLKGILDRAHAEVVNHPEWYPRSVGNAVSDQTAAQQGAALRKAQSQLEPAAYLAAVEGRGAQFVRASGDTRISNADIERQLKQLGIGNPEVTGWGPMGMFPGPLNNAHTAEAVTGKFNFLVDALNDQLKTMGFDALPRYTVPKLGRGSPRPEGGTYRRPPMWKQER